jgi:hypothetical protein
MDDMAHPPNLETLGPVISSLQAILRSTGRCDLPVRVVGTIGLSGLATLKECLDYPAELRSVTITTEINDVYVRQTDHGEIELVLVLDGMDPDLVKGA